MFYILYLELFWLWNPSLEGTHGKEVLDYKHSHRYLRCQLTNVTVGKEGQGPLVTVSGPVPRVWCRHGAVFSSPDKEEFIEPPDNLMASAHWVMFAQMCCRTLDRTNFCLFSHGLCQCTSLCPGKTWLSRKLDFLPQFCWSAYIGCVGQVGEWRSTEWLIAMIV